MPMKNVIIRNSVTNMDEKLIKEEYYAAIDGCIVCPNCWRDCEFSEKKKIDKWQTFLLRLKGDKHQVRMYSSYYCEDCGSSWESERYTGRRDAKFQ